MGSTVNGRFRTWLHDMLVSLDQGAGCWIRGWWFVWVGGEPPDPDETVSSWVGRHAIAGNTWALVAEKLIDAIMGAGHCRASVGS